jgi:hypothetical protein
MNIINVPWENQSNIWWNEVCATIIEHFGLPGDKYTSHPTENNMEFIFKTNIIISRVINKCPQISPNFNFSNV